MSKYKSIMALFIYLIILYFLRSNEWIDNKETVLLSTTVVLTTIFLYKRKQIIK
ncbi:hypothetical protein B795N_16480 [Marinilactibacillus psychrotolerans]|nr:hypothetical protein B795N_16480 [Marinilactibacillus psychrotolerans]